MAAKIIAVLNQKGGCAKTTTTIHLGVGLARQGKRVLLVDADPQASMTIALGWKNPDSLRYTLTAALNPANEGIDFSPYYLAHKEGVDLIPSNITLSSFEASMVNMECREHILREFLDGVNDCYDYILIDNLPSLGLLTINTLTAADSIIIPVQPEYLSAIGMTQLLQTFSRVKRKLNPALEVEGILITMADMRSLHARAAVEEITRGYGAQLRIFETIIPVSVKVREASAAGVSVFEHSQKSKVALAYGKFVREVLGDG